MPSTQRWILQPSPAMRPRTTRLISGQRGCLMNPIFTGNYNIILGLRLCHGLLVDMYGENKYKKHVVSHEFRIRIARTQRDNTCELRGKYSKLLLNFFHTEIFSPHISRDPRGTMPSSHISAGISEGLVPSTCTMCSFKDLRQESICGYCQNTMVRMMPANSTNAGGSS
ncbi:hypothetical protein V2G26_003450 [Clonostachys chloroleuca]